MANAPPSKKSAPARSPASAKRSAPAQEVLDAVFLASATTHDGLPAPMLAEIAFGGRSNVGKSSLINKLVNRRKLVRTSSTPGATRGLALFRATLRLADGTRAQLDLVDLPGYGYAQRSKKERKSWGPMIEEYLEARVSLRAVVLLIDVRRGLEEDDAQLLEYLAHVKRRTILAVTKIDKVNRNERDKALAAIRAAAKRAVPAKDAQVEVIATSAETGEGIEAIWSAIRREGFLGNEPAATEPGHSGRD